jgi:DNA repair photolyase
MRGRGAFTNPPNRFEPRAIVPVDPDDAASTDACWEFLGPALKTTVDIDTTRTIIARNDSPDIPFDVSINPYRGCEHGCIYCFARPTHAYLGHSPGIDFETKLVAKPEAAALLRRELRKPGYRCTPLALGTNTDPFQPIERTWKITRQILEVLAEHDHPVSIVTKSAGVLRDLDLLTPMAAKGLAKIFISVTTLDPALARAMEPRAASPARRIETLREIASAGIPAGVLVSPIIPGLTDHELEEILKAAAGAGVTSAGWLLVRLPLEVKTLFEEWLRRNFPTRAERVLGRIRAMRDGQLNDPRFGSRMRGSGPFAELLRRRFEIACRRLGVATTSAPLTTALFRVPGAPKPLFALDYTGSLHKGSR